MNDSRISLDGQWDFLHIVEDYRNRPVGWRSITVPGPWQSQFSDLRMKGGTGLYRREIDVPAGWMGEQRVFLHFGAVFHITRVWVNGHMVGCHLGGFLPFSFDVTECLLEGVNEIKVRADSPMDDPNAMPEANFAEIPFGKQSWYGPLSGIWQSVWLERRSVDHVCRTRIVSELATGRVRVCAFLAHPAEADADVLIAVREPGGMVVAEARVAIARHAGEVEAALTVPEVLPWSPDAPHLYQLELVVDRQGRTIDRYVEAFGFRTIETRDGRFYLNGEVIYLRAALDQDYYPDTICTTPSVAFLEDQFRKAKELGLNCLRLHIKAPDPRYYEVADRIGLLIWTELPNMGVSTERSRARKEATLKGIVDRDGNHPCIICWTIINENWGVDLVHDPDHRAWLRRTYAWLKAYDPGRLVVDNSPLAPSFHVETDIADYHFYAAFPDSRADWDKFVDELSGRPSWLFCPDDDAVQTGREPLMCSEFGNWGLPDPDALKDAEGKEPWWFETGHDWGEGVMYAHGIENRFADWSLGRVFGDLKGFVAAAQWQQFRAFKYEIEAMRAKESLAGYVITEFTDAHWESNGLLDMRRNTRAFHHLFHTINTDTVIVPKWERLSYWAGETAVFRLHIAHGAGKVLEGATLGVTLEHTKLIALPTIQPGTVLDLGHVNVPVPADTTNCLRRVQFELRDADGTIIATSYAEVAVYAARTAPTLSGLSIWTPNVELRDRLAALGYRVCAEPRSDALWLTSHHNPDITAHVRKGGRLLLFPDADFKLNPLFPHWQNVKVMHRDDTLWRGDWASTFGWLHRGRAFGDIPGGPLLDETFDRVLPNRIIVGCNLLDFQARVHGGLVIGWIHKPVALTVERGYGRGRFVVSTFRLFRDAPGADPIATVLLDRLVALAMAQGSAASRERETIVDDLLLAPA